MIGTSGPPTSTYALSMPRPAKADIRCSIVAMREVPTPMHVDSRVSTTDSAVARACIDPAMSAREKTIPLFTAAGRKVIATFAPECRPTPVARTTDFSVRCLIMVAGLLVGSPPRRKVYHARCEVIEEAAESNAVVLVGANIATQYS